MEKPVIITYVLDDDHQELAFLKPHIETVCGVEYELYTDIEKFMQAVADGVHIGIIDHKLNADVDGIEVGRKVLEKSPAMQLIFFSGTNDKDTWKRATNAGFRRLVDKNDRDCYLQIQQFINELKPSILANIRHIQSLQFFYDKYHKHLS